MGITKKMAALVIAGVCFGCLVGLSSGQPASNSSADNYSLEQIAVATAENIKISNRLETQVKHLEQAIARQCCCNSEPLLSVSFGQTPTGIGHGSEVVLLNETVILERIVFVSEYAAHINVTDGNGNLLAVARGGAPTVAYEVGVLAENGVRFKNMNYWFSQSSEYQVVAYYRYP